MTTEPKSGLAVGVWFDNEGCWSYKGSLPVVMQFFPKTPEHYAEKAIVSRCPACEATSLRQQTGYAKVKRWLILPP